MRVQGVVLEDHSDVAILRGNVIHNFAIDDQLAAGDLFQTRDHAKGSGFTASGRTNQYDELFVFDIKTELLHRHNALICDLQIDFLFRLVGVLFLVFLLILTADIGIYFLDVIELNTRHVY